MFYALAYIAIVFVMNSHNTMSSSFHRKVRITQTVTLPVYCNSTWARSTIECSSHCTDNVYCVAIIRPLDVYYGCNLCLGSCTWPHFYQTRSVWSVIQGSTRKCSAVHNFAPTITKFCVMWEGLSLPHDTKFGNCREEIADRRVIFIWSLIHGSSWSGLIKVGPGQNRRRCLQDMWWLPILDTGIKEHKPLYMYRSIS